jgi:DUF1365 family protein
VNSCLYECHVLHHRFTPQAHRFLYRIFMFALDLDELEALHRRLRFFSFNRRNLYSFREGDFLPTGEPLHNPSTAHDSPATPAGLKARVLSYLAGRGIGQPVAALAEVTNTFKEMKPFVLGPETKETDPAAARAATFRLRTPKYFYVSPFTDMDVAFDFALHSPGDRLAVQIDDYDAGRRTLTSALTGRRRPLTDATLAWFTLKYPLITLRVITLIHWHALRLYLKKVPWFAKSARPGAQRDLYRPHTSLAPAPQPASKT